MPPRAVLVDLGNVLVRFDHMITCRRLAGPSGLAPEEVHARLFRSGLEQDFDLGRISEEDFARRARETLGAPELPLTEVLSAWAEIFTRDEPNIALLASLREQTRTLLLSNTNATHYREAARLVPELSLFSHRVLSFEEGCRKPESEIFHLALERLGVSPEEAVLVDDGAGHVEAARSLGLGAVLHRPGDSMAPGLRNLGLELPG